MRSPPRLVAAGGIGDGRGLAAVLCLGAQAAWLGTRFLLADESTVHPVHAELAVAASEADTVHSTLFDVGWPDAPHRTIRNSTWRRWAEAGSPPVGQRPREDEPVGRRSDGSPIPRYFVGHPTTSWVADADVEAMALYAGQSVGVIRDRRPAAEIVNGIVTEASRALRCAGRDGQDEPPPYRRP
jgi:nitronate monooxygenase